MQQNNHPVGEILTQDILLRHVDSLVKYLEQKELFIQKQLIGYLTNTQSGLGHSKYPIKSLKFRKGRSPKQTECGVWYDIRNKLKNRLQKYKQSSQKHKLLLTSDLLIWSIPNFCTSYMGMMNYIRKLKIQPLVSVSQYGHAVETQSMSERRQLCMKLFSQKQQQKKKTYRLFLQSKDELSESSLLRVPLLIIRDFFDKWAQSVAYYQEKQQDFESQLLRIQGKPQGGVDSAQIDGHIQGAGHAQDVHSAQTRQVQTLETLLKKARVQKDQIQSRIKQAEKYMQDIQSVQSLDPQVYKNRLILNQFTPALDPRNRYLFVYGKRLCFLNILKSRSAKAQKHSKQRKDSIFQLIDKQRSYIEILNQYIEYIKQPIQALGILSSEQNKQLFCNIEQIKGFHQILYHKLHKRYQEDHKYQTYGDIMKSVIPFFKLYIDYIFIAESAQNFLLRLIKQNEKVREICDKYFVEKLKTASNELMQPTFKIARYEMLFDEIIKKTNNSTADFKLFTEAKQLFRQNLTQVNDTVDKIVRRNKLNQLQQQFGTVQQPVYVKENCQYLNEFNIYMVNQQKLLNVILFAFTNVILIAEESTRKKLKYIKVDEKFYARRQQDSKVYRNVIKIHSQEGFLTLTTGNEQKNLKKADQMYEVLKRIQKTTQSNQLIYTQVLGTQQIGSTSFAKYTQYIIQVKYLTLKKLLHLRFSQVANIVKVMQDHYKDLLYITDQQNLKKTWFNNHKSKTIQDRKRTIEQILQKLFNHQIIKKKPKFLLSYLNLPENFFQTAKRLSIQENTSRVMSNLFKKVDKVSQRIFNTSKSIQIVAQSSGTFSILQSNLSSPSKKQSYLSRREMKQAFTLLCATQIKLGRDIYHDLDQNIHVKKEKAQKVEIYINTMKQDQTIMVRVTQYDTVEDVCNKVSKLMGLRSNRDFRLFHEIGKKELRVLQHQQLILKLFSFPQAKRDSLANNVSSMLQSVTSSLKKIMSLQSNPTLIFKKYYFLPFQIQERECKKDLTRLRLLTYQVFSQIKDLKYQLNFDEYLLFAALLIYVQIDGDIDKGRIDEQVVHKIIPQTIFKLKNYTQQEWLVKSRPHLDKLKQQIRKVIQYNQEQLRHNQIKNNIQSKMALHFGHRHLASQIVLNKIKANPIYGSNLFYVQPYKKTYEQLKAQSLKMSYNMWLAVKVDSLSLLTPSSKQSQFELKYSDIQKINVYSEAIVFKTDDYTNKQYRFNTYQSFEISQLVKYYKTLNQIFKELGQDEKLSDEVRKYRRQIQQYRSTYELHEEMDIMMKAV